MTASKKQPAPKPADSQAPAAKADSAHPEVHPERHASSGAQELTTLPGAAQNPSGEVAGGGAGAKQVEVAPNPSIGVTHDAHEASGPAVNDGDDAAEHVYSYEQALSLPIVDKGTPVKAPSDAKLKADHERAVKAARKAAADDAKDKPDDSGTSPGHAAAAVNMPLRRPVTAFKDRDRRTMLVVRTKEGLAAMPAKDFKDAPAPNAEAVAV